MTIKLRTFDSPRSATFSVDREKRTIRGLAVPWGDVGDNGWGRFTFSPGSLKWGKVKLLNGHDWNQIIGTADLEETDEGLVMSARVADTRLGDEVLSLAGMGAVDGLSIGLAEDLTERVIDGVHVVSSGVVLEVSTTPIPAFENAQIRSVAASASGTTERNLMDEEETTDLGARVDDLETRVDALEGVTASTSEEVTELGRIRVPVATFAGGAQRLTVREEPMYRFAGSTRAPSGFDFAEDLFAAAVRGDQAALARVRTYSTERLGQRFIDTTDVEDTFPATRRDDMFLGQAPTPASPLYDFFHKGSIDGPRSFDYIKLDRTGTTAGVGNHTEGVEPAAGEVVIDYGALIKPSPVSGKVHITREVGDSGGNPNASAIARAEFERSFDIARETKTFGLVNAAAASITSLTAAIAAGADGKALATAVRRGLLKLQFLPDGSRFTKGFGHEDFYTALAMLENTAGEPVFPIINPQNRDGISGDKYSFLDIGGYRFAPTATLGAASATASNSYVADPAAVHVWSSGLTSLDKLGERVEGWDIGCFGYFAGIVYDVTGLRKISYDPTA